MIIEESGKREGLQEGFDYDGIVMKSILYLVGTRCGFDLSAKEQEFGQIVNITDEDMIYRLGSLICDVSCNVLVEVKIVFHFLHVRPALVTGDDLEVGECLGDSGEVDGAHILRSVCTRDFPCVGLSLRNQTRVEQNRQTAFFRRLIDRHVDVMVVFIVRIDAFEPLRSHFSILINL